MGNSDSKNTPAGAFNRSMSRKSKRQRASEVSLSTKALKPEIEQFQGLRDDPQYKGFQSILTQSSKDVQNLKEKSNADGKQFCDNVLADIVDMLRILEEVVSNNERNLDSAAVESTSFTNVTPNFDRRQNKGGAMEDAVERRKTVTVKKQEKLSECITKLNELNQATLKLVDEINSAISLEDRKQFVVLERKIKILYTDLEMIEVENDKPLSDKKESIGKKLILYNKKIAKAKCNRPETESPAEASDKEIKRITENEFQIMAKIERELADLEVKVLTYDGVKSDPTYKELDQVLKGHLYTLRRLESSSENNRKRNLKISNLIKKILQELNTRSDENANKIKAALDKINSIEDEALNLTEDVENFEGRADDSDFKGLDQKLRSLWAKLNDVHETYQNVNVRKQETVKTIQNMLKILLEKTLVDEQDSVNQNEEIIIPINDKNPRATLRQTGVENSELLAQTKELKQFWDTINSIKMKKISSLEKTDVVNILYELSQEVRRKIKEIQNIQTNSFRAKNDIQHINDSETKNRREFVNHTKVNVNVSEQQENIIDERAISPIIPLQTIQMKTQLTTELVDKIKKIQSEVREIINQINDFCGIKESAEYCEFQYKLNNYLSNVETFEMNISQVIDNEREQAVNLIQEAVEALDKRADENKEKYIKKASSNALNDEATARQKAETAHLKTIIESLQKLKKKIDCFYGTYKNIQYVQIEKELYHYLEEVREMDASASDKVQNTKKSLQQKILQYLRILDEKSLKVGSQEDLNDIEITELSTSSNSHDNMTPTDKINKLRDKLSDIKDTMEKFSGLYKDESYVKLEQTLTGYRQDLEQIPDTTPIIKQSKEQYRQYINQLLTYFQEKAKLEKEQTQEVKKVDTLSVLKTFEQEVKSLQKDIGAMGPTITDNQFYYMDERVLKLMLNIEEIKTSDRNENAIKNSLIEDIKSLINVLQKKRGVTKRLSGIKNTVSIARVNEVQKEIQDLSTKINNFSGPNYNKDYDALDEKMSDIFLKIQTIDTEGDPLIYKAVENLIKDVQENKKLLNKQLKHVKSLSVNELDSAI